jgi:hypothetical protein
MRVKTLSSLVAVTGMLLSFAAQAQDAPAGGEATPATPPPAPVAPASSEAKGLLGVDVLAAFPFGNLGDGAGIGIGGLLRGEYGVMPQLNITARLGYVHHLAKNEVTFSEIPVWVGAKYFVTEQIYAAAELGLVHVKASVGDFSTSDDNLGFTVGGGYKLGDLDLRAGLHILDLGHAGDSTEIVVSVGYNFLKF